MPAPNFTRDRFYKYLNKSFPYKENWNATSIKIFKRVVEYEEIKEAIDYLKKVNPDLHKYLSYRFGTQRTRNEIAVYLECDSSTFKRRTDKALDVMFNYLNNKDVIGEIEPLDLMYNLQN